jgi:amino acid transporter
MKKLKNLIRTVSLATGMLLTKTTFAACSPRAKQNGCVDLIKPSTNNLGELISKGTTWVLGFVGAIAVLFIIYAGFQYVTAAGNKEQAEAAKKTLTYAVIGIIIIVLAKVIISLVISSVSGINNTAV